MSEIEIKIPNIGDFKNVEVIEVLVSEGQSLKKNDPLITIESDKSSIEIPSNYDGKIKSLKTKIGDKVSEGDLILILEKSSETIEKVQPKIEKEFKKIQVTKPEIDKTFNQEAYVHLPHSGFADSQILRNLSQADTTTASVTAEEWQRSSSKLNTPISIGIVF